MGFLGTGFISDFRSGCGIQRIEQKIPELIGKSGDGKDGEGNRKRLKISIPHFDNSDLVKSYSKTLIGRCMNPAKHVTKNLEGGRESGGSGSGNGTVPVSF